MSVAGEFAANCIPKQPSCETSLFVSSPALAHLACQKFKATRQVINDLTAEIDSSLKNVIEI